MFNVYENSEKPNTLIINFEDMIECNSNCIDSCIEIIESIPFKFKEIKDSYIDEPQDYYYTIDCPTEEILSKIEEYLKNAFEDIEDEFCCE